MSRLMFRATFFASVLIGSAFFASSAGAASATLEQAIELTEPSDSVTVFAGTGTISPAPRLWDGVSYPTAGDDYLLLQRAAAGTTASAFIAGTAPAAAGAACWAADTLVPSIFTGGASYTVTIRDLNLGADLRRVTQSSPSAGRHQTIYGPLDLLDRFFLSVNLSVSSTSISPEMVIDNVRYLSAAACPELPPYVEADVPLSATPGTTVALSALARDPNQAAATLSYEWDLDGDGRPGETGAAASAGDEIGPSVTTPIPDREAQIIYSLIVRDAAGNEVVRTPALLTAGWDPLNFAAAMELPGTLRPSAGTRAVGVSAAAGFPTTGPTYGVIGPAGSAATAASVADITPPPGMQCLAVDVRLWGSLHTADPRARVTINMDSLYRIEGSIDGRFRVTDSAFAGGPRSYDLPRPVISTEPGTLQLAGGLFPFATAQQRLYLPFWGSVERSLSMSVTGQGEAWLDGMTWLAECPYVLDIRGSTTTGVGGSLPITLAIEDPGRLGGSPALTEVDFDDDGVFGETGAAATRGDEVPGAPFVPDRSGDLPVHVRVTMSTGQMIEQTRIFRVSDPPEIAAAAAGFPAADLPSASGRARASADPLGGFPTAPDADFGMLQAGIDFRDGNSTLQLTLTPPPGAVCAAVDYRLITGSLPSDFRPVEFDVFARLQGGTAYIVPIATAGDATLPFAGLPGYVTATPLGTAYIPVRADGTPTEVGLSLLDNQARSTVLFDNFRWPAAADCPNLAPVVSIDPAEAAPGGTTSLTATVFDPNDPPAAMTYAWDLDEDGLFGETGIDAGRGDEVGASPLYQAPATVGTYPIAVRVTDPGGLSAEATGNVVVRYGGFDLLAAADLAPAPVTDSSAGGLATVEDGPLGPLPVAGTTSAHLGTDEASPWAYWFIAFEPSTGARCLAFDYSFGTDAASVMMDASVFADGADPNFLFLDENDADLALGSPLYARHTPLRTVVLTLLPGVAPFLSFDLNAFDPVRQGLLIDNMRWFAPVGGVCADPPPPNLPPTPNAGGPYEFLQDTAFDLDASASTDPEGQTPLSYEWDLDYDGITFDVDLGPAPSPLAPTTATLPGGLRTVAVRVTDPQGASAIATAPLTVIPNNAPPTAVPGGPYEVFEGATVLLDGTASSDPDLDLPSFAWSPGTHLDDPTSPTPLYSGVDDLVEVLTLTVTDPGGLDDSADATVTVRNVAPTVDAATASFEVAPVGTVVDFSAAFTDPGVLDTHTAIWDWDDGTSDAGVVSETDGDGSAAGSHAFLVPGFHHVTVEVTDDDGGATVSAAVLVVVFDAVGGSVSGEGEFDSPPGAFPGDPDATAEAEFSFKVQYRDGESAPRGALEFELDSDDEFELRSKTFEWLVVDGVTAQLRGSGYVTRDDDDDDEDEDDGDTRDSATGRYEFMVWLGDEPDTFRIRIWREVSGVEVVVYDNGAAQPLEDGEIDFHQAEPDDDDEDDEDDDDD